MLTEPNKLTEWNDLSKHKKQLKDQNITDWFQINPNRFRELSIKVPSLLYDFSKNYITSRTIDLLVNLANTSELSSNITKLFHGDLINSSEQQAALHTALRAPTDSKPIYINNTNIRTEIKDCLLKMRNFSAKIREKLWFGATGKPIKNIVNVGIGGSHVGPKMLLHALKNFAAKELTCSFISDLDINARSHILQQLNPEETLFIISSKSFTTFETLENYKQIKCWLETKMPGLDVNDHFIAITANKQLASNTGISQENILPLWPWIGGRYSIWSAIGFPVALMLGMDKFNEFLLGGYEMDQHFISTKFQQNIPIIMALTGIWAINFHNSPGHVIAAYPDELKYLREYIQQLDMESNGKQVNINGKKINYKTGPIILGESGCNAQHSFFQWLHQAPISLPVDFILTKKTNLASFNNALCQAKALMLGVKESSVYKELIDSEVESKYAQILAASKSSPGNRSSNFIMLDEISPLTLGKLIAIYEHKIFVQGIIWQINSFDQWGVELGKNLLTNLLKNNRQQIKDDQDSSTCGLMKHYTK